jgi:hypothetical protein
MSMYNIKVTDDDLHIEQLILYTLNVKIYCASSH